MGKKSNNSAVKKPKPSPLHERVAFLSQAVHLMCLPRSSAKDKHTTKFAAKNDQYRSYLAGHYASVMKGLQNKAQMKCDTDFKRQFCPNCATWWLPVTQNTVSNNASTSQSCPVLSPIRLRIKKRKRGGQKRPFLNVTCRNCENVKRYLCNDKR